MSSFSSVFFLKSTITLQLAPGPFQLRRRLRRFSRYFLRVPRPSRGHGLLDLLLRVLFGRRRRYLVEAAAAARPPLSTFLEGEGGFTSDAFDGTTVSSLTTPFVLFLDKPSLSSIFLLVASRLGGGGAVARG